MKGYYRLLYLAVITFFFSCSGPGLLGKKKSPHQQYESKIKDAGLDKTSLGRKWLIAAQESISRPVVVTIPYSETGYFAADKPTAVGLRFTLTRGERIKINIDERPAGAIRIFLDLLRPQDDNSLPDLLASADTIKNEIDYEVRRTGEYLLRIQPELLTSGEYTLRVSAGPSLAFPVPNGRIQSIWGDPRDAGARKHEGVDIFAPKYTPVLAAAEGRVSRVNENQLGGNVVWLNVANKDYTLYYAHLEKQLVTDGQHVKPGDTVGLVGNTGNARTTPPHLHFGIYGVGGAIDPFPFVNPLVRNPMPITASTTVIGKNVRTKSTSKFYSTPNTDALATDLKKQIILDVTAATREWYRVITPDGRIGFVNAGAVVSVENPLDRFAIKADKPLLDQPNANAARKLLLKRGEQVQLLAGFDAFHFVSDKENNRGWIQMD